MGRRLLAGWILLAALAAALGLGAVGVYAHQRKVIQAHSQCPPGYTLRLPSSSGFQSPSGVQSPATGTEMICSDSSVERPATPDTEQGRSGVVGQNAAIWWWYGAGAVLLLGVAGSLMARMAHDRPEAPRSDT